MTYRVILQRLAVADLQEAYEWAARRAPRTAQRWLKRFEDALQSLERNPQRCPFARENGKVEVELREFLLGKPPFVFRVVFTIDQDAVRILRVRRAQRRFLTKPQIDEAMDRGSETE